MNFGDFIHRGQEIYKVTGLESLINLIARNKVEIDKIVVPDDFNNLDKAYFFSRLGDAYVDYCSVLSAEHQGDIMVRAKECYLRAVDFASNFKDCHILTMDYFKTKLNFIEDNNLIQ